MTTTAYQFYRQRDIKNLKLQSAVKTRMREVSLILQPVFRALWEQFIPWIWSYRQKCVSIVWQYRKKEMVSGRKRRVVSSINELEAQ